MGRLTYLMNVSLDGFIETTDHSLAWGSVDDELHAWFGEQTSGLDASLYGRRVYELMAAYWPTAEDDPAATDTMRQFGRAWNPMPKVVFSTTLERVIDSARLVSGDVGTVLEEVRREFDGDLAVAGPNLAAQFARAGLIDVYHLVVHPVVLGSGTPYWPPMDAALPLRATGSRVFGSGVVASSYAAR